MNKEKENQKNESDNMDDWWNDEDVEMINASAKEKEEAYNNIRRVFIWVMIISVISMGIGFIFSLLNGLGK